MPAFAIIGLLLAQAAPITVEAPRNADDVAYHELAESRPADALAALENGTDDPAALLNRGTAQLRLGQRDAALASYRAALSSRVNYDLELQSGAWVNSRDAARHAIRLLHRGETLALK